MNSFSINKLEARKTGPPHAPNALPPRLHALLPKQQEIGGLKAGLKTF